jgi:DNA-directed RNA polymerase sigma subunit (sigma70/sigma32)
LNDKQLAESLSTSIDFVRRVKSAFNTRVWSYDKSLKETSNELNPTSFLDKMSAGPSEGVFSGGETDFEEFSGESSGSQLRLGLERILEDFVDPFEMKVVRMLYGLDDGKSRNVEEIARKLGKAADEVRNARSAAFTKLRKHVCLEEAVRS